MKNKGCLNKGKLAFRNHKKGMMEFIKMGIKNPKILYDDGVYDIAKECIHKHCKKYNKIKRPNNFIILRKRRNLD